MIARRARFAHSSDKFVVGRGTDTAGHEYGHECANIGAAREFVVGHTQDIDTYAITRIESAL